MDTASSSERTHLSVLGLDPELAATCVSCARLRCHVAHVVDLVAEALGMAGR